MTDEPIDAHTGERIVGLRGLTDDQVVDLLLDQQAAAAIADAIRDQAMGGGDTVANRRHTTRSVG